MDDVASQSLRMTSRLPRTRSGVVFVLTAAATFVIVVTLFVSPAPTRSIEAILSWADKDSNELIPGLTSEELLADDFLEEALVAADPSLQVNEIDPLLDDFRTGIHFQKLAPTEEGRARLGIQYRGDYAGATAVVNTAAELIRRRVFVEPERLAAKRYEDLAVQAEQTAAELKRLEEELEELRTTGAPAADDFVVQADAADQNKLLDDAADSNADVDVSPTSWPRLPEIREENPRWIALQQELVELQQELDQQLIERSPQHPAVRVLKLEVIDHQQQLAAINQYIDEPDSQTDREIAMTRAESQLLLSNENRIADPELFTQKKLLILQKRTSLAAQHAGAEHSLRQLADLRSLDIKLSSPAGELPPTPGAGWPAVFAVGVALLVGRAFAKRAQAEDTVFRTVNEAASVLPTRIVGVIRSAAPLTPRPAPSLPRWIGFARIVSIGILAIAFIAVVYQMLASGEFASLAMRAPIRALADTMRGLL